MGGFVILNETRATLEKVFNADLLQIRWGIWAFGAIATAWFIWRGVDGFYRKMDFVVDDNDHHW